MTRSLDVWRRVKGEYRRDLLSMAHTSYKGLYYFYVQVYRR